MPFAEPGLIDLDAFNADAAAIGDQHIDSEEVARLAKDVLSAFCHAR